MSGGHSELEPPLPIPNRAVKQFCANDSVLLACESRSPPDSYPNPRYRKIAGFFHCASMISSTGMGTVSLMPNLDVVTNT